MEEVFIAETNIKTELDYEDDMQHDGLGLDDVNNESLDSLETSGNETQENQKIVYITRKGNSDPPLTAFTLWAKKMRQDLIRINPNMDFYSVSKKLNELWDTLTAQEKFGWSRKAKLINQNMEHVRNNFLTKPLTKKQTLRKRAPRTTKRQQEIIANFLEKINLCLINNQEEWRKLANILNESGVGPKKTLEGWKKAVREIKSNVRRRAKLSFAKPKEYPLTELEERLLVLMGVSAEDTPVSQTANWILDENSGSNMIDENFLLNNLEVPQFLHPLSPPQFSQSSFPPHFPQPQSSPQEEIKQTLPVDTKQIVTPVLAKQEAQTETSKPAEPKEPERIQVEFKKVEIKAVETEVENPAEIKQIETCQVEEKPATPVPKTPQLRRRRRKFRVQDNSNKIINSLLKSQARSTLMLAKSINNLSESIKVLAENLAQFKPK